MWRNVGSCAGTHDRFFKFYEVELTGLFLCHSAWSWSLHCIHVSHLRDCSSWLHLPIETYWSSASNRNREKLVEFSPPKRSLFQSEHCVSMDFSRIITNKIIQMAEKYVMKCITSLLKKMQIEGRRFSSFFKVVKIVKLSNADKS